MHIYVNAKAINESKEGYSGEYARLIMLASSGCQNVFPEHKTFRRAGRES